MAAAQVVPDPVAFRDSWAARPAPRARHRDPAVTGDDAGLAATLPGLREPGPAIEQDRLVAVWADAAVQPAGMR